ncbi:MAG: hypothetical protein V3T77_00945, partial [Planctomycetota bacterium]
MEEPGGGLEKRCARVEAISGRRVALSPLAEGVAVVADREETARLPLGARGVPATVALGRLAALVEPRRPIGVYWAHGRVRVCCVVQRGRVVASSLPQLPWLLLTPPDAQGERFLSGLRPSSMLALEETRLPRLAPLALLAVGVALAAWAPGSFPPPAPSRLCRVIQRVLTFLPWLLMIPALVV